MDSSTEGVIIGIYFVKKKAYGQCDLELFTAHREYQFWSFFLAILSPKLGNDHFKKYFFKFCIFFSSYN